MREQNYRNARQPANEHRRVLWLRYFFQFFSSKVCLNRKFKLVDKYLFKSRYVVLLVKE
jgi:hypothetical protein